MDNKVQAAVKAISECVNSFNSSDKEFAELMLREHKTLQQSAVRMFLKYLEELAKQDDYDLRNRAAIHAARKITKLLEEEKIALPLV